MAILKEITNLLTTAQLDEAIVRIVMKNGEPQVIVQFSVNSSSSNKITDTEKALRSALCLPLIFNGNEECELAIIDGLKALSEPLGTVVGGIAALNIGNVITAQAESAVLALKKKKKTPKAMSKQPTAVTKQPTAVIASVEQSKAVITPKESFAKIEDLNMDSLFSTDSSFLIK
ncbi:hypothetical protein EIJ81_00665 (plasmid) [Aliivibrio salmonicida]|uniref:hypothetical protein n=1 Tax=Aliivibrio salmonicida TaxID=40269 RepID=UPI000F6B7048|nr:hypothetical protein [Aliivibrio salmonicida]AZL83411.1 hypothetical protein EIJ81_00665 [Aliivibrio salmonicida]